MPRLYGAPPVDEVRLAGQARPFVQALRGQVPDAAQLRALSDQHGTDLATMVFYEAVRASDDNREFIRGVQAQPVAPSQAPNGVKLFILPALFYRERPEVGGDGAHIADVARACGIQAELIPTQSKGGVTANAPLIRDALKAETADRIWLLSLSKGGAELRHVFQHYAEDIPLERIETWLNVGGLPRGCHLIDLMFDNAMRRVRTRALCSVTGVAYHGLEEFRTTHRLWQTGFTLADSIRVVNVVGTPLLSHMQKALLGRYSRLRHLGPNDGLVLLPEALWLPGHIYPVWGADHFFRSTQISPLLYRLFGYLLKKT